MSLKVVKALIESMPKKKGNHRQRLERGMVRVFVERLMSERAVGYVVTIEVDRKLLNSVISVFDTMYDRYEIVQVEETIFKIRKR